MNDNFPEYYRLTDGEFDKLWSDAVFVFDTNVLLNLYRQPKDASSAILERIEDLRDRIWIPHQVALEYHRRRLTVICELVNQFSSVKEVVTAAIAKIDKNFAELKHEKRHSLIDAGDFLSEVSTAKDKLFENLKELEDQQLKPNEEDPIQRRLEDLFKGKVGEPPSNQEELDSIYSEGDQRYQCSVPPGFADAKNKEDLPDFWYGSLRYQPKFGDLILWKQVLKFASEQKPDAMILVTDDSKEDWWLKVKADGPKTIGPRPELIRELNTEASVKRFHLYNSENFLDQASQFLDKPVAPEMILQVREAKRSYDEVKPVVYWRRLEEAAVNWLEQTMGLHLVKMMPAMFDFSVAPRGGDGPKSGVRVLEARGAPITAVKWGIKRMLAGIAKFTGIDQYSGVIIVIDDDSEKLRDALEEKKDWELVKPTFVVGGRLNEFTNVDDLFPEYLSSWNLRLDRRSKSTGA